MAGSSRVVGEGADHGTRGRVRSPDSNDIVPLGYSKRGAPLYWPFRAKPGTRRGDTADMIRAPEESSQPPSRSADRTAAVLFECAVDAAVRAFFILLFGSIALHIVGGIWHDMTPSLPPGFAHTPTAERSDTAAFWGSALGKHRFFILSAALFALLASTRLMHSSGRANSERLLWWQDLGKRVSENWFGLIVGNAFGAMIAAMVAVWVQRFSWTQWLWHWLLAPVIDQLLVTSSHLFGNARTDRIHSLFAWYGQNQLKFNFWLLYLASIGDDLGIPNLKTLARRVWHGRLNRKQASGAAPSAESVPCPAPCATEVLPPPAEPKA